MTHDEQARAIAVNLTKGGVHLIEFDNVGIRVVFVDIADQTFLQIEKAGATILLNPFEIVALSSVFYGLMGLGNEELKK